jgi:prepilin-type N-terminal cleavage/methylation domain-containing protein
VTPIPRRLTDSSGFTLVELLVVMLILGILAAVGIATFLHQRSKGEDAAAKVYVTTASKAMGVWHNDHGTYAGATRVELAAIEPSLSSAAGLVVAGDADSYTVSVDSTAGAQGGGTFTLEYDDDGTILRTCANAGRGACADAPDAQGNSW